jgi:serine/threonine protein kinase
MSNLAYVVMDEPEEIICGYLVDEHPLQESLYAVLRRANENRVPLPWDARRRWAIQLVSAVHSLHAAGFVHGALTLNTVFLVPGSSQPAENLPDIVATHTILVSCPTITSRAPWPDIYSSPELLIRHVNKPPRFCLSTQSDLYALGVILWALAVQDCEPALYRRNWSRLAFPITHAFEPGTTWRFPVRDAIRDCLNTQPQNRPTTDFLLQVLKEDAPTEIRTEPQADDFDTPVSRHEVHEQRQAEAALTRDLQALLEDYGLSKRTDDILLDTLDVEPAYEGLTLEERKLARWEHSDRSAASMAHTLTMSQAAGVEIEMDEEV